jgi:hypothetical protein
MRSAIGFLHPAQRGVFPGVSAVRKRMLAPWEKRANRPVAIFDGDAFNFGTNRRRSASDMPAAGGSDLATSTA